MRLLYESIFIPTEWRTLIPKMGARKVFLMKPKHHNHLSQQGECEYGVQSWKERRLFYESMFIPIERWTWTLKMVKIEVSLSKRKHQYHLSQWGECVYGA